MSKHKLWIDRRFRTWSDFVDYACGPSDAPHERRASRDKAGDRDEFTQTKTWEDAVRMARTGWAAGAKRARVFTNALTDRVVGRIRREEIVYDVEGMGFDVGRLLDGEPEHWQRYEETGEYRESPRHVKITMNGSVSCGVSHETIIARGSTIAALSELLEYAGHRVEIELVFGCSRINGTIRDDDTPNESGGTRKDPRNLAVYRTVLKRYDQPLDMDELTFAVAHPSTFRRLVFSCMERENEDARSKLGAGIGRFGGYSYPSDLPQSELDECGIYVPAAYYGDREWHEPNAAERFVLEHLQACGVELRDED